MSKELSEFEDSHYVSIFVRMIQLYIVKMLHFNTLTVRDYSDAPCIKFCLLVFTY